MAAVSAVSRSDSMALALGTAVLIAPAAAAGAGASILLGVSLGPLLGGNTMLQAPLLYQILYGSVGVIFAVGSVLLVKRQWKRRG